MLLQIRDFIHREQTVSTQQLAREFHLDEQALQPMLDLWVKKDVIRAHQETKACQGGCFRCNTTAPMYYHFNPK